MAIRHSYKPATVLTIVSVILEDICPEDLELHLLYDSDVQSADDVQCIHLMNLYFESKEVCCQDIDLHWQSKRFYCQIGHSGLSLLFPKHFILVVSSKMNLTISRFSYASRKTGNACLYNISLVSIIRPCSKLTSTIK